MSLYIGGTLLHVTAFSPSPERGSQVHGPLAGRRPRHGAGIHGFEDLRAHVGDPPARTAIRIEAHQECIEAIRNTVKITVRVDGHEKFFVPLILLCEEALLEMIVNCDPLHRPRPQLPGRMVEVETPSAKRRDPLSDWPHHVCLIHRALQKIRIGFRGFASIPCLLVKPAGREERDARRTGHPFTHTMAHVAVCIAWETSCPTECVLFHRL